MTAAAGPSPFPRRLDIADPATLADAGLHPATLDNVELFSRFSRRLVDNLTWPAISPRSGLPVAPAHHFGIDSDPWMHAILYSDGEAPFIVFCRGLTETSAMGGLYLVEQDLLLENRKGWYFHDVFRDAIERNLPRATEYFSLRPPSPRDRSASRPITAAIGNKRVGDFVMQLAWLEELTSIASSDLRLDRILVNRASEFVDVALIFPELETIVERQPSGVHIEYRARHLPGILLSDVRSLAHKAIADPLRARFARAAGWLRHEAGTAAHLAELTPCPLTIWISIEIEKRVWAEQRQALPLLLTEVAKEYLAEGEPLGIVHNGFTATEDGVTPVAEELLHAEKAAFADLVERLGWPVRVVSCAGKSLRMKAVMADRCDLIIGPIGSATVVPSMLFGKPGVIYGSHAISRAGFKGPNTEVMPDDRVIELPTAGAMARWTSSSSVSYSMDWRDLLSAMKCRYSCRRGIDGRLTFQQRVHDST